jgi:hypothetical protein
VMKQMDRDELIERELDNRICLHILAIIAIVFSSVFVIITTLAVSNLSYCTIWYLIRFHVNILKRAAPTHAMKTKIKSQTQLFLFSNTH